MVSKKNALGKGLSALLENANTDITASTKDVSSSTAGSISRINITDITPNPFQPRIDFEKEPLLELVNSIKEHGIIQPITVRKMGRDDFQIISGEILFFLDVIHLIQLFHLWIASWILGLVSVQYVAWQKSSLNYE